MKALLVWASILCIFISVCDSLYTGFSNLLSSPRYDNRFVNTYPVSPGLRTYPTNTYNKPAYSYQSPAPTYPTKVVTVVEPPSPPPAKTKKKKTSRKSSGDKGLNITTSPAPHGVLSNSSKDDLHSGGDAKPINSTLIDSPLTSPTNSSDPTVKTKKKVKRKGDEHPHGSIGKTGTEKVNKSGGNVYSEDIEKPPGIESLGHKPQVDETSSVTPPSLTSETGSETIVEGITSTDEGVKELQEEPVVHNVPEELPSIQSGAHTRDHPSLVPELTVEAPNQEYHHDNSSRSQLNKNETAELKRGSKSKESNVPYVYRPLLENADADPESKQDLIGAEDFGNRNATAVLTSVSNMDKRGAPPQSPEVPRKQNSSRKKLKASLQDSSDKFNALLRRKTQFDRSSPAGVDLGQSLNTTSTPQHPMNDPPSERLPELPHTLQKVSPENQTSQELRVVQSRLKSSIFSKGAPGKLPRPQWISSKEVLRNVLESGLRDTHVNIPSGFVEKPPLHPLKYSTFEDKDQAVHPNNKHIISRKQENSPPVELNGIHLGQTDQRYEILKSNYNISKGGARGEKPLGYDPVNLKRLSPAGQLGSDQNDNSHLSKEAIPETSEVPTRLWKGDVFNTPMNTRLGVPGLSPEAPLQTKTFYKGSFSSENPSPVTDITGSTPQYEKGGSGLMVKSYPKPKNHAQSSDEGPTEKYQTPWGDVSLGKLLSVHSKTKLIRSSENLFIPYDSDREKLDVMSQRRQEMETREPPRTDTLKLTLYRKEHIVFRAGLVLKNFADEYIKHKHQFGDIENDFVRSISELVDHEFLTSQHFRLLKNTALNKRMALPPVLRAMAVKYIELVEMLYEPE